MNHQFTSLTHHFTPLTLTHSHRNGQLEFVRSRREGLWPCLLEKAINSHT
jgi:hypothetical protein